MRLLRIIPLHFVFVCATMMVANCSSSPSSPKQHVTSEGNETKYKTYNPHPADGFDENYLRRLVDILASDALDDSTKDSCVVHIWNAFTDPLHFDNQFNAFSTQSLRLLANGQLDIEERPYLAEWSNCNSDLEYLWFVVDNILEFYKCKSHGDDTDGVGAALYQIKQTRAITRPIYLPEEDALMYVRRLNKTVLANHGKVALIQKGSTGIFVCDKLNMQALKDLALTIKWVLVEP